MVRSVLGDNGTLKQLAKMNREYIGHYAVYAAKVIRESLLFLRNRTETPKADLRKLIEL